MLYKEKSLKYAEIYLILMMTNYATALPGISALLKLNKDKEKEKEADRRFLADFRAAIRDDVLINDSLDSDYYDYQYQVEITSVQTKETYSSYASNVFKSFRRWQGVQTANFIDSICNAEWVEKPNPASSGARLFFTKDGQYILKTVNSSELNFLTKTLLQSLYLNEMRNKNSQLVKLSGLYCHKKLCLLIQKNVFPNKTEVPIKETFDMKGSTQHRKLTPEQITKAANPVYRDLNFTEGLHPDGLYINNDVYFALMKALELDFTTLENAGATDYSILMGIHYLPPSDKPLDDRVPANAFGEVFVPNPIVATNIRGERMHIYIGIIDLLNHYGIGNEIWGVRKFFQYGSKYKENISVINSDGYARRIFDFTIKHVFHPKQPLTPIELPVYHQATIAHYRFLKEMEKGMELQLQVQTSYAAPPPQYEQYDGSDRI